MGAPELLQHLRGAGLVLTVTPAGGLHVAPRDALTDDQRIAIRAQRDALVLALLSAHADLAGPQSEQRRGSSQDSQDSQGHPGTKTIASCTGCLHLLRRGTCREPVAAGLLTAEEGFGIVWPPVGHGAACSAFIGKMPTAAVDRPHRLTNDEADRGPPCWDNAEIAAFTARTERFALLGRADADDLAERLTLRDRDGDDRRLCLECTWLGDTGRCLAAATGRIPGADRRLEPVQTILQRCDAFGLRKGLV